jgi:hypothetical protein
VFCPAVTVCELGAAEIEKSGVVPPEVIAKVIVLLSRVPGSLRKTFTDALASAAP